MAKMTKAKMADLFGVLGSPHRITVLGLYAGGGELSAKMVASKLKMPLANVSYHVRELRENGLIGTVREEPRRGAVEKYQALTATGELALELIDHAGTPAP